MTKQLFCFLFLFFAYFPALASETITFYSTDSLTITADTYISHSPSAPFIILFHQAGFSRGEYLEIAPELSTMGFNVMAVDQRSGKEVNGIVNHTASHASDKNLRDTYLDAWPDMMAAIQYAKNNFAQGPLILWGSSYSASLVLKIGGDEPDLMDGLISFSPGEYFERLGKSENFIAESAKNIQVPVFITSARSEKERWWSIYQEIPSDKVTFLPETEGIHGSRALWSSTPEHEQYWNALKKFLDRFIPTKKPAAPSDFHMK
jgi:dienelactone hydrolase